MKFLKIPAEQSTAVTNIMLALVAFGGIVFLRYLQYNSDGIWKINIWSAAIGLIGLSAMLGAVAHGVVLSRTSHRRIWLSLNMTLGLAVSLFVVGVVHDQWGFNISLATLPILLMAGLGFYLITLIYPGIFFFSLSMKLLHWYLPWLSIFS